MTFTAGDMHEPIENRRERSRYNRYDWSVGLRADSIHRNPVVSNEAWLFSNNPVYIDNQVNRFIRRANQARFMLERHRNAFDQR